MSGCAMFMLRELNDWLLLNQNRQLVRIKKRPSALLWHYRAFLVRG